MAAAIPGTKFGKPDQDRFAQQVKANVDWITGQHKNAPVLVELPSTAVLADLITEHNKVVRRLNGDA